jgi:hypothetical protein
MLPATAVVSALVSVAAGAAALLQPVRAKPAARAAALRIEAILFMYVKLIFSV